MLIKIVPVNLTLWHGFPLEHKICTNDAQIKQMNPRNKSWRSFFSFLFMFTKLFFKTLVWNNLFSNIYSKPHFGFKVTYTSRLRSTWILLKILDKCPVINIQGNSIWPCGIIIAISIHNIAYPPEKLLFIKQSHSLLHSQQTAINHISHFIVVQANTVSLSWLYIP